MKIATAKDSPALWPYRWLLPVERISGNGTWNDRDLGVLTHDAGVIRPVVYIGNMLELKTRDDLDRLPREEFPSLAALFEKWKVD